MSSKTSKVAKGVKEEKPALAVRVKKYFEELKFEWVKITFPTRKELTQSTIVVFIFTMILMVILSGYDWFMTFVFNNWIIPT